jgi:sulfoxide reductase heme-binding subunit YedZ
MRVPWRDRQGRFLKFKATVLALTPIPGLYWAFRLLHGDLGGRPVNEVIHGTGSWTVRWLMLALAITPFARIVDWPRLLTVRRMVGVTAMAYALTHFSLYIVDQKFHLLTVASEIALRFYLTIGFVALCGLVALGVTSTDAMMKRMGKRWKQLHRLVYPIGVLALLHFFIQTKANVGEPVFVSGLFVWLMLWRLLPRARQTALWIFYALVPVSAVLTAAVEFAWYGLATKIDPFRILSANWNERFFPRPAHEVAAAALAVALVVTVRRLLSQRSTPRPTAAITPARANSP